MKLTPVSSDYSLTDSEGNVIGAATVIRKDEDSSLELMLGEKLSFSSREEVVSFLEQIVNIME